MKKLSEIFKRSKSNFMSLSIAEQDKSNTVSFHVNKEKGIVVCRLYDRWYDCFHVAKAHCLDTDKFSEKRGRAIAFNRARQKELEHNLKEIEAERQWLNDIYNKRIADLDKRQHLNVIYLTGVRDELAELVK